MGCSKVLCLKGDGIIHHILTKVVNGFFNIAGMVINIEKMIRCSKIRVLSTRLTVQFKSGIFCGLRCGVEQWQLVGLITRRSQVQVLPPLLIKRP